jgi:hypothetical protein
MDTAITESMDGGLWLSDEAVSEAWLPQPTGVLPLVVVSADPVSTAGLPVIVAATQPSAPAGRLTIRTASRPT